MPTIASFIHHITHRMTDGWHASKNVVLIMNAAVFSSQRRCRCARQPQVQSKVDVLGGPPVTAGEADVQMEHLLNLMRSHKTDRENGYRN